MSDNINHLISEYQTIIEIREKYISSYLKTNFYLGMILVTLWVGIEKSINEIFLLIPLLVLIQYAIVQWNQYHHFLTEEYLIALEKAIIKAKGIEGNLFPSYFSFYKGMFGKTFLVKELSSKHLFIKPTALLSTFLTIFNLGILSYSTYMAVVFLNSATSSLIATIYGISIAGLTGIIIVNFIAMPKTVRKVLKNNLDHHLNSKE